MKRTRCLSTFWGAALASFPLIAFDRKPQSLRCPENCRWRSLELIGDDFKGLGFRQQHQLAIVSHQPHAAPSNSFCHDVAPRAFNCGNGRLFFVLCLGAVTANKWRRVSAEERSLFRRQSSRPPGARPFSFARRPSIAAASGLKGSFGLCLQSQINQPTNGFGPCGRILFSPSFNAAHEIIRYANTVQRLGASGGPAYFFTFNGY
jgi:hypothetical protein